MATTTPITESILANVATALALITTGNGFRKTIKKVDRQYINPECIGGGTNLPALAVFGEEINFEVARTGPTPGQNIVLSFDIQGIAKDKTTPATTLNAIIQDVREKLYEDRSRGGFANDTHITFVELGGEPFGEDSFGNPPFVAKPFIGFLMTIEVIYQEDL